jgi:hypothetical protein
MCVFYSAFAHETAGAARTRSSLRPLLFWGERICKTRAHRVARTWSYIQPSSLRTQGPIRRVLSFRQWSGRLSIQPTPGVMGPCVRRDDSRERSNHQRHCEERSDEAIHSLFARQNGLLRFARNDGSYRDKFCSRKFSAVLANTCMFSNRSFLPVSSVIADASAPAMPMQLWPAASP